jgi:CRP-like cAMP-binding protein
MLHLRSLPIFTGLTTRQLMDLALAVSEEDHPAGADIVREGDFSDCLYLVVDGRVQVTKSGKLLAEQGPRSFFGEIAIFEGAARSATVQAAVPTRVLRLGRTELIRLMEEFPGIAVGVCQNLSRRVRELSDRVTG